MNEKKENLCRCLLVILDGWGHGLDPKRSAIALSKTPTMDYLYKNYPNSQLVTFGKEVGLPEGQMGNSEVGHLNIGAGRIVHQDLAKINNEILTGGLSQNEVLIDAIQYAKKENKRFHLMGLVSDGGVHAHIKHLKAIIDILDNNKIENCFIHAFLDGRDTSPHGGLDYIKELLTFIDKSNIKLASVIGRYFAMDRDKRWSRIKKAYDLLVNGIGEESENFLETIKSYYDQDETDEFMPAIISKKDKGIIREGDVVFFINYRTDRPRQLTQVLCQEDMPDFDMKALDLYYCTMTEYSDSYDNVKVMYMKENLEQTIGEVIAEEGLSQMRIAETEKYPHVSFFFSGGREKTFKGEKRIMVPSPKVATYNLQPEMNAAIVTDKLIHEIKNDKPDFICLNYANTDMVGHTGDMNAAIIACETVDTQLGRLIKVALENNYSMIVIADHGNSDIMIKKDGSPHTAHTTNLVPCIYISKENKNDKMEDGILADIAPTILDIMKVTKPKEMTGKSLITKL